MKPERWQQLDQLFHAALERKPEERAAFLDEACAGDEELRKEVEALIAAHEQSVSFIEKPALEVEARLLANEQSDAGAESMVGKTIGHYRLIALLGYLFRGGQCFVDFFRSGQSTERAGRLHGYRRLR